ncbi:hypothetical protein FGO68_gene14626 [Halteria grandinella]|uniref:Uncharacterized protein n=1 Tax=Halteria grandinella TaxID=5974 RepID=A0A8J8SY31_HALGN|nr:hypothetical protein FGO68_gene14626 [Halteria grandinella]
MTSRQAFRECFTGISRNSTSKSVHFAARYIIEVMRSHQSSDSFLHSIAGFDDSSLSCVIAIESSIGWCESVFSKNVFGCKLILVRFRFIRR